MQRRGSSGSQRRRRCALFRFLHQGGLREWVPEFTGPFTRGVIDHRPAATRSHAELRKIDPAQVELFEPPLYVLVRSDAPCLSRLTDRRRRRTKMLPATTAPTQGPERDELLPTTRQLQ